MPILRCPYCGERIKQGSKYCSNCGEEIDKPIIDQIDTYWEDTGKILATIFKLIILWWIMLIVIGCIFNILNVPVTYGFLSSFPLTILVYLLVKR